MVDKIVCKECGKEDVPASHSKESYPNDVCFNCWFWQRKVDNKADPNQVVINGNCYYIGDERPSIDRGFGGRLFHIQRLPAGEVIRTTNLWHNGIVPEHFRERLPNNAKFVAVA